MGIDRGLAPLLPKLLILILIDMDDHRVAADTSTSHVLGLLSQAALSHLFSVLARNLDLKGLAPSPAALGKHAHGTATKGRIRSIVGEGHPVCRVVSSVDHVSHRGCLQHE